jgi:hypothetical protein
VGRFNAEGEVLGSGEAWVFTNGSVVKGVWSRPTRDNETSFAEPSGVPIRLTPGRTWVAFAPIGTPVAVQTPPPPAPVAPPG